MSGQNCENYNEFFNDDFDEEDFNTLAPKENIDKTYLDCLKTIFGHSNFRDMQWKVISSVMNDRRDNCIVMSTGYGKSLCYQFPSVYLGTVTIVVSPLISLMEDQVLSLTLSNIKACLLGTAQKDKSVLNDVYNFEYNLVYVTPEFLTGDFGSDFLKKLSSKLTLIAIDEAHCISKWGHDFRSAFRSLGFIRRIIPDIPILAMTATATDTVRKDIISSLQLRNPQELCTGFDRSNLEFHVCEKSKFGVWQDIGIIIQSVRIGSIIVYCLTRAITEEISEVLNSHNIKSTPYHAGLSLSQRKLVHEEFVRDKCQVIVATIAFGMGIDKPDVRMVIHYGASKDLESYYQEVGRAGRDGMPAKCFMFFSSSDWRIHEMLASKSHASSQEIEKNRKELSFKIKEYVGTLGCRREFIIKYFEGTTANLKKKIKNCCDNCKTNAMNKGEKLSDKYEDLNDEGYFDFTRDAEHFFRAVEVFNGYKGLTTIMLLLRGSKRQTLGEKYYSHPLFGIGKDHTEEWWKSFATIMEINQYIHRKQINLNTQYGKKSYQPVIYVIELNDKSRNWITNPNRKPILLKPDKTMYKSLKQKRSSFLYDPTNPAVNAANKANKLDSKTGNIHTNKQPLDEFKELLKILLKVRGNIASTLDVMPYMILSNKALHQLTQKRPVTLDELKEAKLDGLSDVKATKFGPAFIKSILQFKNFLPPEKNTYSENNNRTLKEYINDCPMPNTKPPSETLLRTYDLFAEGKSTREICQLRSLAESTIANYMNDLIRLGFISTKKELRQLGIAEYQFDIISEVLPKELTTAKLKDIKEQCPPTITYDMIKYVLSYNQLKEHCKMNNIQFFDTGPKENDSSKSNVQCSSKCLKAFEKNKINHNKSLTSSTNETLSNEKNDSLWNSDDDNDNDIDFGYLDSQVEQQFNNSIIPNESSISSASLKSPKIGSDTKSNDNEKELDLLLNDIEKNDKSTFHKSREAVNNNKLHSKNITEDVKSRRIVLKKKNVMYIDSSDDSSDDNNSQPQTKKKFPNWIINVKK